MASKKSKKLSSKGKTTAAEESSDKQSFFENVYDVVRLIPSGRATSYGAIAKYLGTGRSARLVGWAMNASGSVVPPVPAHRVVNRNGMLSGKNFFEDPNKMQQLLEKEGMKIEEDQIVNFKNKIFWDPMHELDLEN